MLDVEYMRLAMQLAKSVKGQTTPNPPVGAVIVKDGAIVGVGAHLRTGEAHAEVIAIEMAGEKAKGGTIYVTLEPCSHFGETSPCADLIIESGIKRVVIACEDPNEKVAGKGIRRLEHASITVEVGLLQTEAAVLYDVFFHYIKKKIPYITVKSAVTLDGKTATKTGDSKWITSEAARRDVHRYRHNHDAILVGVNTVIHDNPNLTTHLLDGGRNPIRLILDTELRTPETAHVVTDCLSETWIFVGSNVSKAHKSKFAKKSFVRVIPLNNRKVEIMDVLKFLGEEKVTSVFVEGGAKINSSFLQANVINQFILYQAPKLLGGQDAFTSFSGEGISKIKDAMELTITHVEKIGEDVKIIASRKGEVDVHGNY